MDILDALEKLIRRWPHQRDVGYYLHPDGREERLWEAGCHSLCRRCQLENFIATRRLHDRTN